MKLDQQADISGRQLYTFLKDIQLPSFVKEADHTTAELKSSAFADEVSCSFPIDTPANTYISHVFLSNKEAALSRKYGTAYSLRVMDKLAEAAMLHKIQDDCENYTKVFKEKKAKDLNNIEICTMTSGDLSFSMHAKTAEEYLAHVNSFTSHVNKLPFAWRCEIAKSLVEKAAQFGVDDLPDFLCKYAGLFYASPETAKVEITRRMAKYTKEESIKQATDLLSAVDTWDCRADYFKTAEAIYNIEVNEGVLHNKALKNILGDPVNELFTLSIDKVAEMLNTVTMGGEKFSIEDLQRVPAAVYEEAFGTPVNTADPEEIAVVLPTMPLSDVAMFKEISGVVPVA